MAATHICPKCRAFIEAGTRECPYCQANTRHVGAPGPREDEAATARVGLYLIGYLAVAYALMILLDPAKGAPDANALEPSWVALEFWGVSSPFFVATWGQYWRLVTAVFIHLDPMHLAFNCIAIYVLVPLAAGTFGLSRATVIYLASGVLAAFGSHLAGNGGAGASGAVCGLIGAAALYGRRRQGRWANPLSERMLLWAVIIGIYGLMRPNIDNVAHGVGFVVGAALGWLGAGVRAYGSAEDRRWMWGGRGLAALIVAILLAFQLPSVVRSFQRREMELYAAEVRRAWTAVEERLAGKSGRLPADMPAGPSGTEEVREALRLLLNAVRDAPASAATRQAAEASRAVIHRWQERLARNYYLWPEDL